MALTKMKFDNDDIPFPKTFNVSLTNVQESNLSEGGRTLIQQIRTGVLSARVSTKALSDVLKLYKTYSQKSSFVLTIYEPITETTETRTVYMDDFSYGLEKGSDKLTCTNGIYDISFNLKEF